MKVKTYGALGIVDELLGPANGHSDDDGRVELGNQTTLVRRIMPCEEKQVKGLRLPFLFSRNAISIMPCEEKQMKGLRLPFLFNRNAISAPWHDRCATSMQRDKTAQAASRILEMC